MIINNNSANQNYIVDDIVDEKRKLYEHPIDLATDSPMNDLKNENTEDYEEAESGIVYSPPRVRKHDKNSN